MRDRMAHRGPDGAGIWRSGDGTCVFGHRRLSIIDLSSAADQPMRNREGTVSIIFNGEIYKQMAGSGGHGFHLWTVLNAVLWHERWIEGNADPLGVG